MASISTPLKRLAAKHVLLSANSLVRCYHVYIYIYIYNQCPKCGAQYVGSTIGNLSTRAAEHAGVSVRTGLPLAQPCQSHIRDHVISCNSNQISLDHFSIIGTNNTICELRILESLHIFQIKPQLNSMQSAYTSYLLSDNLS